MIRWMRLSRYALRCLLAMVVLVVPLAPSAAIASVNAPIVLKILTPRAGEVIHNNQDKVTVGLLVLPKSVFQEGLRIRMRLDGKFQQRLWNRPFFTLDQVYRGKHTLQAALVTQNGHIVALSPVVVFYLWQASRLFHTNSMPLAGCDGRPVFRSNKANGGGH
ncbi:hypothetical protein RIE95_02870 [Acidithiobacillus thiooxidans]|uniref:hypothetical protein n=1 Tax=Acidithiobacillus TaxID=119977 RepID=UPI00094AB44E|nr:MULTISPECIES: hypothetical protein [Acidithiobacillus]MDR7925943.1 hypothetical protein [Acidithiobacillus thiooxidans]